MVHPNGVGSDRLLSNGINEDEQPAAASSRILTVRNDVDPTHSFSTPTDPADVSSPQNIPGRRNATRPAPNPLSGGSLMPISGDDNTQNSGSYRQLRPVTPSESVLQDEHITPNGSPLGQEATELLVSDGPMTPTNNAGPFVFDGSAGRMAGRRADASLPPETESTA